MIDRDLLRRTMKFHGITNEKLSQELGITRNYLQAKLRELKFTVDDVQKMKQIIPLTNAEIIEIFFKEV